MNETVGGGHHRGEAVCVPVKQAHAGRVWRISVDSCFLCCCMAVVNIFNICIYADDSLIQRVENHIQYR
jgi:hypothetical protein